MQVYTYIVHTVHDINKGPLHLVALALSVDYSLRFQT
jgi:hypothetical protein